MDMRATEAKERILRAGFTLISQQGYVKATTREIAKLAGVSEVTLFRNFKNKENLFAQILKSFSSIPAMAELLPTLYDLHYEEALDKLIETFIARLEANSSWIQLLQQEMRFAPESVQQTYTSFLDNLFALFADYFRLLQARGVVREDIAPESIARALHSMTFGYYQIEKVRREVADKVEIRRTILHDFRRIFCCGTQR